MQNRKELQESHMVFSHPQHHIRQPFIGLPTYAYIQHLLMDLPEQENPLASKV